MTTCYTFMDQIIVTHKKKKQVYLLEDNNKSLGQRFFEYMTRVATGIITMNC